MQEGAKEGLEENIGKSGREVWVCAVEKQAKMIEAIKLGCQVANVKKPFIAVTRIAEHGNIVDF